MSGRGFDIRDRGKHVLNLYLFFSSDFPTGLTGRKAGRRHMKGRRAPRMEKVEGLLGGGRRVRNSVNFQTLQNPTETPDMWPPSTLPTWGGEEGPLGLRVFYSFGASGVPGAAGASGVPGAAGASGVPGAVEASDAAEAASSSSFFFFLPENCP